MYCQCGNCYQQVSSKLDKDNFLGIFKDPNYYYFYYIKQFFFFFFISIVVGYQKLDRLDPLITDPPQTNSKTLFNVTRDT